MPGITVCAWKRSRREDFALFGQEVLKRAAELVSIKCGSSVLSTSLLVPDWESPQILSRGKRSTTAVSLT